MSLKLYQIQIAAGVAFAALQTLLGLGVFGPGYGPLMALLEPASFALCCSGIIMGGRTLRIRFLAFGSDKALAMADPVYMKDRQNFQISCIPACVALTSLLGARYNIGPLYIWCVLPVALAFLVIPANYLTGWTKRK